MTPKITEAMANSAIQDGAKVQERPKINRPKPKSTPIPDPAGVNIRALEALIGKLVETFQAQLIVAEKQNVELRAMIKALAADKPMRLKPIRDMNRESPTYLLTEYIDVIPVAYTQKLDS